MKCPIAPITASSLLFFVWLCCARATDQQFGIVGVVVSDADHGLVSDVVHGSPAAAAGIVAGDRVLMVGSHEVAALKTREEFRQAAAGPVGESITLRIRRARDGSVVTLQLRRIAPDMLKPKDIPPESDMRFLARATALHLTRRCS